MQNVGRIVQLNTTNSFVFEGCVNRRMISIEECSIPPMHVEEMKKIMGGEICQVNIKNQREGGQIHPTPVVATSNTALGELVPQHIEALQNRCHVYQCSGAFRQLEDWPGKALDPRVYILLLHQYNMADLLEAVLDEVELKKICDHLDSQEVVTDPDDVGNFSTYDGGATPDIPSKAVVGFIDNEAVVSPYLLTPRELEKWLPGWKHYDLTWERSQTVCYHFRVWARYSAAWLGIPFNTGNKFSGGSEENFCNSCSYFHPNKKGKSFEDLLADMDTGDSTGTSVDHRPLLPRGDASPESNWTPGLRQGERVTLIPRYWEDPNCTDIIYNDPFVTY